MRYVGYARNSSGSGEDSLAAQREAMRAWCGGSSLTIYEDEARSGTLPLEDRPGLRDALADLEAGGEGGLLLHRLDRLARELHVQEAVLAKVWGGGGRVFTCVEGEIREDDPDDPMRTFVRQVMGAAAQLERGLVVARMQGGRRRARSLGRHVGGDVPYGYALSEGLLVPDPEQQQGLLRAEELRADDVSYARIAERLNEEGIKPARGVRWWPESVRRAISRGSSAS